MTRGGGGGGESRATRIPFFSSHVLDKFLAEVTGLGVFKLVIILPGGGKPSKMKKAPDYGQAAQLHSKVSPQAGRKE